MDKRTYRVIALFLSVLTLACVGSIAFAADSDTQANAANESMTEVASASEDKADYYSRIADMNEDWMLNSADARRILRLAVGLDWVKDPDWLPKGTIFGDMDENGFLNTADARGALRVALKLNTVSEIIAAATPTPEPTPSVTVPSGSDATTTTTAETTTQPVETTTNPNAVVQPLCDPFAVRLTASGVTYTLASDGLNCYMAASDVLDGLGIYVDADGNMYLLNTADEEYAPFTGDLLTKLGYTPEKIRDFVVSFAMPEFGVFDGWTVSEEVEDMIPYTVATRGDVSYRFYADGSLYRVDGKTYSGGDVTFTEIEEVEDLSVYTEILDDYSAISTNMFILKNGLSIIF